MMETIIGLIYDSVLAPSLSAEAVEAMRQKLGATAAWVMAAVPDRPGFTRPAAFDVLINVPADSAAIYLRDYSDIDPMTLAHLANRDTTTNVAFRNCDVLTNEEWTGSKAYREIAAPFGIGHLMSVALVPEGGVPACAISFARPVGAQQFSDEDRDVLQSTIPHLLRAARLRKAIASRT